MSFATTWTVALVVLGLVGACQSAAPVPDSAQAQTDNGGAAQPPSEPARAIFASLSGDGFTPTEHQEIVGGLGIRGGAAPIQPGTDPEIIRTVVRTHRDQIRACYEQAIATAPDIAGKIVMRWTITPSGAVSEVSAAEDKIGNAMLSKCMVEVISTWQFPKPSRGGKVLVNAYPFVFKQAEVAPSTNKHTGGDNKM